MLQKTERAKIYLLAFLLVLPHLVYQFCFQTPIGKDFLFYQHRALLRSLTYLNLGYFPLWSPWMFSGMSATFEHSLSQVLSPLSWIYLLFPASLDGALLKVILHYKLFIIGLGGCFAFLFFWTISKVTLPSLIGALLFMFNFRMLDNFRYSTPVEILAFLPLLLLFTEYCTRPIWTKWIWIGYPATLGIMLLSGHPQHNIYNLLLVSLYFVFKMLLWRRSTPDKNEFWSEGRKRFGFFLLLNLAGIGLSAPLNLPFLWDVMPFLGKRIEATVEWNNMFKLEPFSLLMNFGFPWFADVHSGFYSSMFGIVLGLFAFCLLISKKETFDAETRSYSYFFFGYFFLALFYSLGSSFLVLSVVNTLVPVLKSTRCPGRMMGTGVFCFAGVVVFLLKWVEHQLQQQQIPAISLLAVFRRYFAGMLLVLGVFLMLHSYFQKSILERYSAISIQPSPSSMIVQQSMSFIIFGLVLYFLLRGMLSLNEKRRRLSYAFIVVFMLLETRWYHSRGTWFLEQFPSSPTANWFLSQDTYHHRKLPEFEYGEALEQGKYPSYNAPQSLIEFLRSGDLEEKALYENLEQGKVFVPRSYLIVSEMSAALKLPLAQLRMLCLLEKKEIETAGLQEVFGLTSESPTQYKAPFESHPETQIVVLEYTPNLLTFEIVLKAPAVVNVLDGYHPGFIARANDKPVPILKTYGLFKGIFLPAGKHQVSIRYEPKSFFLGLKISLFLLAMGLTFLGSVWANWKFFAQKRFKRLLMLFFLVTSVALAGFVEQEIWRMAYKTGCFQYVPRSG